MSCSTQIEPLQLRFSNVTLTNDGRANSNGIALQIGSPGQILSLTPTTLLNNTAVTNRETCSSSTNTSCIESIGGGFNPSDSSSFRTATSDSWNGSVETDLDSLINVPSTYFNDILALSSSRTLPGFPLLLQPAGAAVFSMLGLGANSTFINRLVEAGLAPSRSWSFFAGVYSDIRAGALIIGGYAERFYQGTLHSKNVTDACAVCFEVARMEYRQGSTTTNLLPDGNGNFTVAVDPYYPFLIVPDSMLDKFGNATNGVWSSLLGMHSYSPDSVPTGEIVVTLANGLATTIPNNALFNPPAYDNGLLSAYRNDSMVYGVFSGLSDWGVQSDDSAVFGMPFAAMVYLIHDFERHTVSIANANQGAEVGGDATAICPPDSESGGTSNHAGAIAGGVVGGVVGLALIIFLAWFFRRRKKRKTVQAEASADDSKSELPYDAITKQPPESSAKASGKPDPLSQEMSADSARVELAGTEDMPPREMPADSKIIRSELPA